MFHEKSWDERVADTEMFYHSERIFEKIWPGPFEHFGLGAGSNEMATYKMPPFLMHTPDYIGAYTPESVPVLIEVQGTGGKGRVQQHKFKQKKLGVLGKWNSIHEVTFWLWSDVDETYVWTSYASIRLMIAQGKGTEGQFDGKRPYWAIPVETVILNSDTERLMEKYGGS